MELVDFVDEFALGRTVSKGYIQLLRAATRQLRAFAGEPIRLRDLEKHVRTINQWLASIEAKSPVTAANKRRHIRVLWATAEEEGLAPPVHKLRKIKVPRKIPQALLMEDIQRLLAAADRLEGCFQRTNVSRRWYARSFINTAYDTCLRPGDVKSIERDWIWPGGYVSLVISKTGRTTRKKLRPETLQEIDMLLRGRTTGPIWGTLNKKNFHKFMRKLFKLAGVPGSTKWLRRSSASYAERENPGTAWRLLDHSRPGVDGMHYCDPRIVFEEPFQPPPIFRQSP